MLSMTDAQSMTWCMTDVADTPVYFVTETLNNITSLWRLTVIVVMEVWADNIRLMKWAASMQYSMSGCFVLPMDSGVLSRRVSSCGEGERLASHAAAAQSISNTCVFPMYKSYVNLRWAYEFGLHINFALSLWIWVARKFCAELMNLGYTIKWKTL